MHYWTCTQKSGNWLVTYSLGIHSLVSRSLVIHSLVIHSLVFLFIGCFLPSVYPWRVIVYCLLYHWSVQGRGFDWLTLLYPILPNPEFSTCWTPSQIAKFQHLLNSTSNRRVQHLLNPTSLAKFSICWTLLHFAESSTRWTLPHSQSSLSHCSGSLDPSKALSSFLLSHRYN